MQQQSSVRPRVITIIVLFVVCVFNSMRVRVCVCRVFVVRARNVLALHVNVFEGGALPAHPELRYTVIAGAGTRAARVRTRSVGWPGE